MQKPTSIILNLILMAVTVCAFSARAQTCTAPSGTLAGWWKFDGTLIDEVGSHAGVMAGSLNFSAGQVEQAVSFNGSGNLIRVPAASALDVGTSDGFTVEGWIYRTSAGARPVVEWNSGSSRGVHIWVSLHSSGDLYANLRGTDQGDRLITSPGGKVGLNAWHHVALTYARTSGMARLYADGALIAEANFGSFIPQTAYDLVFGDSLVDDSYFGGAMDEMSLYSEALAAEDILSIFNAGAGGKCREVAPAIRIEPQDTSAFEGGIAQFSVSASGSQPLSYQWFFETEPILSGTNATLTLTNLESDQSGSYSVTVSNSLGTVSSSNAILAVDPPPPCATPPSNLAGWWKFEGTLIDEISPNSGTMTGPLGFSSGVVGQAVHFNGTGNTIRVPGSLALNAGEADGFTVEGWIYRTVAAARCAVEWNDGSSRGVHIWVSLHSSGDLYANLRGTDQGDRLITSPGGKVNLNTWHHVALTYDKPSGVARLYCDGEQIAEANFGSFTPLTSYDLVFGTSLVGNNYFGGAMDEMSVFRKALSVDEITSIFDAGPGGKCRNIAPIIHIQPQDISVFEEETAEFFVSASGNQPLDFQWYFGPDPIPSATNATLTLADLQSHQSGTYFVIVSNAHGTANSSNAVLTVNPPPPCTTPASGLVGWWRFDETLLDEVGPNPGVMSGPLSFSAGKVDSAVNFDGSANTIRVPGTPALNVGEADGFTVEGWIYRTATTARPVIEWNDGSSRGAHIWVSLHSSGDLYANIRGTDQGDRLITSPGEKVNRNTWHHVALTYDKTSGVARLYCDGASIAEENFGTFTPLTSQDLVFGHTLVDNSYFAGAMDEMSVYAKALSSGEIASIFHSGVLGKCLGSIPPSIVLHPGSQTAVLGDDVTLSVSAGGSRPLSYQWKFNGQDIDGATEASLLLADVQFTDAGTYAVMVANEAGSIEGSAVLSVVFPTAAVYVSSANAMSGRPVEVSVMLAANGNENALGFSLTFDTQRLTFDSVVLGSGALGGTLLLNTNQASGGILGIAVAQPAGSSFAPGTREVVIVSFTSGFSPTPDVTAINFADQPTMRQLSDPHAQPLAASFVPGDISLAATVWEGDVAPRPTGDRSVMVTDWVQLGRFAARLDTAADGDEFQRADCAPRSTLGDGRIGITDWVQAGRYAIGLDPLTVVGGPTAESNQGGAARGSSVELAGASGRVVSVSSSPAIQNVATTLAVSLQSEGNENALGMSLSFDAANFEFVRIVPGSDATGATLNVNAGQAASGQVGFILALPIGSSFAPGTRQVARVELIPTASAVGDSPVGFSDQPVPRELSDSSANALTADYQAALLSVNPLPSLTISRSGTGTLLAWPAWAEGFHLQSAATISTNWSPILLTPQTNNGNAEITLPLTEGDQFFRLQRP